MAWQENLEKNLRAGSQENTKAKRLIGTLSETLKQLASKKSVR